MWDFLTGIPTQNFMRGTLKKVFWGNVTPGAFSRALALLFRRLIQLHEIEKSLVTLLHYLHFVR
jgi:hypothetical protein